jgi:AraC-like DNA-binding protein
VAAIAEALPFEDQSFDAAMAFATAHHWQNPMAGLSDMQRVARRVVAFSFDTAEERWRRRFWLTRDYLTEVPASPVGLATELATVIGASVATEAGYYGQPHFNREFRSQAGTSPGRYRIEELAGEVNFVQDLEIGDP